MEMKDAPIIGKDALGRDVRDLSVIPWWGVDRKTIDWSPTIDSGKCSGCATCFITCGRRVYDWDTELQKAVVVQPDNCQVGCTTCANLCPSGAIRFPDLTVAHHAAARAQMVKKAFQQTKHLRPEGAKPEEE